MVRKDEVVKRLMEALYRDSRTAKQIATEAGISLNTLSMIVNGRRRKLHRRTRVRLAEALGLDPVTLEPLEVAS